MTELLQANESGIARAAETLRTGGLVAFPTETVYGLGANANLDEAVARIFAAKNRPSFNPLIVHVADAVAANRIAHLTPLGKKLADRFWPGALTLVLPRRSGTDLSRLVSAGLDTVAVRVPARPEAHRLITMAGVPVAAPSANPSGRISATTAAHVTAALSGKIDLVLDGGPCELGLESTVLDCTGDRPALLRPGGVTIEAIESLLSAPLEAAEDTGNAPRSPGRLAGHYAPELPLRLDAVRAEPGEALLGFGPVEDATLNLSAGGDLVEAAANLFAFLHALDDPRYAGIAVSPIPHEGLGRAINDRLRRAAARTP